MKSLLKLPHQSMRIFHFIQKNCQKCGLNAWLSAFKPLTEQQDAGKRKATRCRLLQARAFPARVASLCGGRGLSARVAVAPVALGCGSLCSQCRGSENYKFRGITELFLPCAQCSPPSLPASLGLAPQSALVGGSRSAARTPRRVPAGVLNRTSSIAHQPTPSRVTQRFAPLTPRASMCSE